MYIYYVWLKFRGPCSCFLAPAKVCCGLQPKAIPAPRVHQHPIVPVQNYFERVTDPLLTSGKEDQNIISPHKLNFGVRGGKLWIYTLHNPPEILCKLAPPGD